MTDARDAKPRTIIWDPRMMISEPYYKCPQCAAVALGTLMISARSWARRCRECMHDVSERLPALSKKVVYLDQMVLSNIAKALDPVWRGTRRKEQDPFWLTVFKQLERLLKLQLIVCPSSPIHERESLVTPYASVLERLREYLGAGTEFDLEVWIHARQLHRALDSAFAIAPLDYLSGGVQSVIRQNINEWMDRLQLRVNFAADADKPDQLRAARDSSDDAFEKLWRRWSTDGVSFEERYTTELGGLYDVWYWRYREYLAHFASVTQGQVPMDEEFINPRLEVEVVRALLARFKNTGDDVATSHQHLAAFLNSDAARLAPANSISALLMAALARKAASGQRKAPRGGAWNDIKAISTYLPYCDAVFIDDQFAGLLREEPLRSRLAVYQPRIFSNQNRGGFLDWLRRLELDAEPAHIAKVLEVYGEGWLQSFTTVLEHERERLKDKGR